MWYLVCSHHHVEPQRNSLDPNDFILKVIMPKIDTGLRFLYWCKCNVCAIFNVHRCVPVVVVNNKYNKSTSYLCSSLPQTRSFRLFSSCRSRHVRSRCILVHPDHDTLLTCIPCDWMIISKFITINRP